MDTNAYFTSPGLLLLMTRSVAMQMPRRSGHDDDDHDDDVVMSS